jgi:TusA-related sulfurtransferase
MTPKRIDARGLSCPQPVVLVDKAIASGETELEVIVDNEVARENVSRLAARRGLKIDAHPEGMDIVITTTKAG